MAMEVLTVRGIEVLKPRAKRYEVFDALTPSLALRATPSGHKSWVLYYRHHGRQRRLTLGRYPDRRLAEARSEAIQQRGRILNGADPAAEKQAGHAENAHTVQALYELYRSRKEKVLRSWSEVRRILEKEILPTWRHRRVADIQRRDVRELVEQKAQTPRSRATACWTVSPRCSRLRSTRTGSKPVRRGGSRNRDRNGVAIACSRDELRELWPALHETEAKNADGTPKPRLSQPLNDVFLVMLLTAQRCGEVCQMQWREVDLDTGWWLIPGDVSKNHDPHRVPLPSIVLEILDRRARAENADDRYVFSNHRHTCGCPGEEGRCNPLASAMPRVLLLPEPQAPTRCPGGVDRPPEAPVTRPAIRDG